MLKNRCQYCHHIIDKREIAMFAGLVKALWKVYTWCQEKGIHEFKMNQVREMLGRNEYARFGDWVLFGGLVYKTGKAYYGLNMERCDKFFANELEIPSKIWKDPITGELEKVDYRRVTGMPKLLQFLNQDMEYQAKYSCSGRAAMVANAEQTLRGLGVKYEIEKGISEQEGKGLPPAPQTPLL
jgi:hypothetical protein